MSGGALNYASHRLDDPIKDIEQRIRVNGKTVQQIWDDKTEEEKKKAGGINRNTVAQRY